MPGDGGASRVAGGQQTARLVECVPNFSEGRDRAVIDAIVAAITSVDGVLLLAVDPGPSTHRTVVTFVAPPEVVVRAAFTGIAEAARRIDMRGHRGVHPRQGATDVCPLIPLGSATVAECLPLAEELAARVGADLGIAVYLYQQSARREARRELSWLRRGEYEGLAEKLTRAEFAPDFGPTAFNPRSGATVVGVRPLLIAYNVTLETADVRVARAIAGAVRENGRVRHDATGHRLRREDCASRWVPGLAGCRARAWFIAEYRRAQVTMNLTDVVATPPHVAYERVRVLAAERGVRVSGSELVGLVPKASLLSAGRFYAGDSSEALTELELMQRAIRGLGLDHLQRFDVRQRVLEYRLAAVRRD